MYKNSEINIRLEHFEGPFDLLFHLIDVNQIDIYDIPIAELTDQYIAYIRLFPAKDMDSMSEFILMAATLLEIKSKMLLPKDTYHDNAEDEADPRDELVEKLIEYKRFKSVITVLKEKETLAEKSFFRLPDKTVKVDFNHNTDVDYDDLFNGISMDGLYKAFEDVLNRRALKTDKVRSGFNSVSRDLYTIQEKIEHIENLLLLYENISFFNIFSQSSGKAEKIVTFLALLELIKLKKVIIKQNSLFEDISIYKWKNDAVYDD